MKTIRYRDLVAYHAEVRPDQLALRNASTGQELTYRDFHLRANRLARHLQDRGVARGDRVAVLAYNGLEHFEVQYACNRIGAITVPLNWRLAQQELGYIAGDCTPAMLVHDIAFGEAAAALLASGSVGRAIELDPGNRASGYERAIAAAQGDPVWAEQTHDDLAFIMYTSGTAGRPKGALITHGMVWWNTQNIAFPGRITSASVQLVLLPLFHIGGLNSHANPILHAGGTVVLQKAFNAGDVLRLLGDPAWRIDRITGVPAQYQFLSNHPDFAGTDLSRLTFLGMGGSPCPEATLKAWLGRGVPLGQGFGMTETSPGVTLLDAKDLVRKAGSVGKPLPYVELRIVDEDGRDVVSGTPGELWLRGPNVTPGYWNRADATAAAFRDGWFRTGDVCRRDEDGFVYIVDRVKDMYISGGENVSPAEVENVLCEFAGVSDAAVVGISHERWGESGLAVVVLRPGVTPDEQALLAHCKARLAKFKVPSGVVFVEALPRNAAGKVLKRDLRRRFAAASNKKSDKE